MNNIYIFINTTAVIIFVISLLLSFLLYNKESQSVSKAARIINFSFILSALFGACYFLYNMSHEMTLVNIGNYLTVLMLVIIYPSITIVALKIYQQMAHKNV